MQTKKRVAGLTILSLVVVGLLFSGFASAGWFSNLFKGMTGNVVFDNNNLLTNGDAEQGPSVNWEQGWNIWYEPNSSFVHSGSFSFLRGGNQYIFSKEFIPIDVSKSYKLEGWFKSPGEKSKFYYGFVPYDKNKQQITVWSVYVVPNTETTLVDGVHSIDTCIKIADSSGWKASGAVALYSIAHVCFNVDDSGNYNDLPNRNCSTKMGINNITNKGNYAEVCFKEPIGVSASPGTKVRMHSSGSTYMYSAASGQTVPNEWKKYEIVVSGESVSGHSALKWWRGTKYAKVMVLANYHQNSSVQLLADDMAVYEEEGSVPPSNVTCTDSDGGLNYYVAGNASTIQDNAGALLLDQCCADLNDTFCNKVSGQILAEAYCQNPTTPNNVVYSCPNGCVDGACVNTTSRRCYPLDIIYFGFWGEIGDYFVITNEGGVPTSKLLNITSNGGTNGYPSLIFSSPVVDGSSIVDFFPANDYVGRYSNGVYYYRTEHYRGENYEIQFNLNLSKVLFLSKPYRDTCNRRLPTPIYLEGSFINLYNDLGSNSCTDEFGQVYSESGGNNAEIFTYSGDTLYFSNVLIYDEYAQISLYSGESFRLQKEDETYASNVSIRNNDYIIEVTPDKKIKVTWIDCSGTSAQSCQSLIDLVKNPINLTIDGITWMPDSFGSGGGNSEGDSYYSASWAYRNGNERIYAYADLNKLSSPESVRQRLDSAIGENLCEQDSIILQNGSEQVVYLCKNLWRLAYDSKEISDTYNNYQNDVVVLWINDNVLFSLEISSNNYNECYSYEDCVAQEQYRHRRQQEDLIGAVEKLIDNQAEYVGGFHLGYHEENLVKYFLEECNSEIEGQGSRGSWFCKQEPVICPPHGEQTQTCTSYNNELGKEETREATVSCNPGICSGCYVPRWFGNQGDNTCIPYGFRFAKQIGWTIEEVFDEYNDSEGLSVKEVNQYENDASLVVYSNNTALLILEITQNEYVNVSLVEGNTYDWDELTGEGNGNWQYELYVDEISYDSNNYEDSYIKVTFHASGFYEKQTADTISAYCDIDGIIKEQKTQAWGACQNNFECESNFCSYGECVDLQGIADQVTGIRGVFVKVLCKLANLFDIQEYNQCVVDNWGDYIPPSSGSGGGGGGSNPPAMPE